MKSCETERNKRLKLPRNTDLRGDVFNDWFDDMLARATTALWRKKGQVLALIEQRKDHLLIKSGVIHDIGTGSAPATAFRKRFSEALKAPVHHYVRSDEPAFTIPVGASVTRKEFPSSDDYWKGRKVIETIRLPDRTIIRTYIDKRYVWRSRYPKDRRLDPNRIDTLEELRITYHKKKPKR